MSQCINNSLCIKKNNAILSVRGVYFRCILWGISRSEGLRRLNNSVLEDKGVL